MRRNGVTNRYPLHYQNSTAAHKTQKKPRRITGRARNKYPENELTRAFAEVTMYSLERGMYYVD